jgi:acid phosphatase type 7
MFAVAGKLDRFEAWRENFVESSIRRTVRGAVTAASMLSVFLTAGCGDTSNPSSEERPADGQRSHAITSTVGNAGGPFMRVYGPRIVAVGDVACAPGARTTMTTCRHAATARQAKRYNPRYAFVLGDAQYEKGTLRAFRNVYDKSWGTLRRITKPILGNHEYGTQNAGGYFAYFRNQQPGPPGYYTFNVGTWRVYALNSNCGPIACPREARWLEHRMDAQPAACSMILLHHPRYSSGLHGNNSAVRRFWRIAVRHRTDVALAGHDHDYERFRRMDASGGVTPRGMASFVAGTGGKSLYPAGVRRPGSVVFDNHRAGVLALRLGQGQYAWKFRTIDGRLVDQGVGSCRR